jgi:hypothetical protein
MSSHPKLIQVPAQIIDFKPRPDRSYKVVFETRQLSGDEVSLLADNFQGEGWLLFKPNGEINIADVPKDEADAGNKTPSQRIRSVIYVKWEQTGRKGSFNDYYHTVTSKIIEFLKDQLEPEED